MSALKATSRFVADYNPILDSDSYKNPMFLQYPKGTQYVSSYIEARTDEREIVMFGLLLQLRKWELNPITMEMIEEAASYFGQHGVTWNREGWEYILNVHGGRLPLRVEALPEGTVIAGRNVVAQIVNTDPNCAWLPTYVEPPVLRSVWYGSSVSTLSRKCKAVIAKYLLETSGSKEGLEFKLHDFGARGSSSEESSAIAGAAHLVNFLGTDTLMALRLARQVYGADVAGFSIDAAEHSTITSWGRENEYEAYRNMIKQFGKPGKYFAVVSDSFDIMKAVTEGWGGVLKQEVISCGGTLVVRPDSGRPAEIVRDVILALMDAFGCEFNSLGYKVLPPYIRVIQGDGINLESIEEILEELKRNRISAENVAFGMGGALHMGVVRDTYGWAMKCSAICVNGTWQDVVKDPITDQGKKSKGGRLALVHIDGSFKTVREDEALANGWTNYLVPVFADGKVLTAAYWDQVRSRAA